MNDINLKLLFKSFSVRNRIFTALLITDELFLIIAAAFFSIKIRGPITTILVCAPCVITFIYALLSVAEKGAGPFCTLCAFIADAAVFAAAAFSLYFLPTGLYILTAIGMVGIVLFLIGFSQAKVISSYGLFFMNACFFAVTVLLGYGMLSSHAREGARDAISTIIGLPLLFAFVIADMASVARNKKAEN